VLGLQVLPCPEQFSRMQQVGEECSHPHQAHDVSGKGEIMSRSFKHVWAGTIACCRSKKEDKRIASGTYRANAKRLLQKEGEEYIERDRHEFKYGDDWGWGCDGTSFYGTKVELMAFVADADEPQKWYHKMLAK